MWEFNVPIIISSAVKNLANVDQNIVLANVGKKKYQWPSSVEKTLSMLAKQILTNVDQKPVTVNTDWKHLVNVDQKILPTDID